MKILIEGCDATGKSTLAERLNQLTGWRIEHCSKPKDGEAWEYFSQKFFADENLILDRWVVGNPVYAAALGHKEQLSIEEYNDMLTLASDHGTVLVVCWDDPAAIAGRFASRGEDFTPVEQIERIQNLFLAAARNIADRRLFPVVLYNAFTNSYEVLFHGHKQFGIHLPQHLPTAPDARGEGIPEGSGGN